jgi:hypothetical protein
MVTRVTLPSDAGRGLRASRRGRLRNCLIALTAACLATPAAAVAAQPFTRSAFIGRGMWIWQLAQSNGGDPTSIAGTAATYGVSTLVIKAGDGSSAWSQFNPQVVAALHASGLRVCAWQYVYGLHPIYEAWVGAAAVRAGADCLVVDAESEYQGRYVQAQRYITELRRLIGTRFPVGLAGFPYIDYHPGFPYSVFLGRGAAQYNVPQMYWPDIGTTPDQVYSHTYGFNALYQRPIEPIGEVAVHPPSNQVLFFRQLSRVYGASLVSWWDWQASWLSDWGAISQPLGDYQGLTASYTLPALTVAASGGIWAGDLVVWAQEHLLEAGDPVQVDGDFGPLTQAAVQQFQSAHRLPITGIVDQATWQALLSYPRPNVVWTTHGGKTTASAARAGLPMAVPWSARLPARGYEIPRDLGAGR